VAFIEVNGRLLHDGQTVMVDHNVQVFTVVVRGLAPVHPDTLKNIIQQRLEVVSINQVEHDTYVRKPGGYTGQLDSSPKDDR
jgi:hypothetical protein